MSNQVKRKRTVQFVLKIEVSTDFAEEVITSTLNEMGNQCVKLMTDPLQKLKVEPKFSVSVVNEE